MNPINLVITLPELERLAAALEAYTQRQQPQPAAAPAAPAAPPAPQTLGPAVSSAPATLTAPVAPAAPAAQPEKTYTKDDLVAAASKLVDEGKAEALRTQLEMLGAKSLLELSPEKYPAFAYGLKQLGADL